MSYETLVKQVKTLPEECLEDVSKYIDYLLYQYELNKMESLVKTEEQFNRDMQNGLDDIKAGRVKPLDEAFADIRKRFASGTRPLPRVLSSNREFVKNAAEQFDNVWMGAHCKGCKRKEFCGDPIG